MNFIIKFWNLVCTQLNKFFLQLYSNSTNYATGANTAIFYIAGFIPLYWGRYNIFFELILLMENKSDSSHNEEVIEDKVKQEKTIMKDPVLEGVKMQNIKQKSLLIRKDEVNVLILYTGGTFGMMKTPDGYQPK